MREGTLIATSLPVTVLRWRAVWPAGERIGLVCESQRALSTDASRQRVDRRTQRLSGLVVNLAKVVTAPPQRSGRDHLDFVRALRPSSSTGPPIGRHVGETIRESNDPPVEEVFICDIDSDQVARLEATAGDPYGTRTALWRINFVPLRRSSADDALPVQHGL
jgi:hypothetical protein